MIYERLLEHVQSDFYPMHMPGHKRNKEFCMVNPYEIDITEIDGFDNLHEAEELLRDAMKRAAAIYQTKETFFLVNGSTCGLLAGISALTKKGDKVLVARNSHKAVYNAIFLNELHPIYLYPEMDEEYGIALQIDPKQVRERMEENTDIKLIVITSPTYEGIVSDIQAISEIAHEYGACLLVDEAHGAHLPFMKNAPKSALSMGADVVIQSVHKTLPAFTQTALLHINSDRVNKEEIRRYLGIYQTSSPSYVLMAGIDQCMQFLENGSSRFLCYEKELELLNQELLKEDKIRLWQPMGSGIPKDPTKLVLTKGSGSGRALYDEFRLCYHIQPEMASKDYVLLMSTVGDTKEGLKRVQQAVRMMNQKEAGNTKEGKRKVQEQSTFQFVFPKRRYEHCKTRGMDTMTIPFEKSEGMAAATYVYLYPPGIPLLVPGEVISEELLAQIDIYRQSGLEVKGLKEEGSKITVLREESAEIL